MSQHVTCWIKDCLHFWFTKYYSSYQVKKNTTGGACSTYGTGDVHRGFWWGYL